MNNSKKYKLGELTTWKSGGTPSKDKKHFWNGDIPWISAKNLTSSRISTSDTFITKEGLENGSRLANKDSILLLVRGSGLYNGLPVGIVESPVAFNQDVKAIEADRTKLDPWFLLYWLIGHKELLNQKLESTGIGAGKFDTDILKGLDVKLPELEVQKRIAAIAKCWDDKIELNRRTNHTLEQMAQTLFKKYFVTDIDPDNLPEGWSWGKIGNLISIQNGFAFKSNDFKEEGHHGIIKIKNINNNVVDIHSTQFILERTLDGLDKKFKVQSEDVLIAMTGAEVGKIGIVPSNSKSIWLNQRVGKFVEKISFGKLFAFFQLTTEAYQEELQTTAMGSAQPNISASDIENIKTIVPSYNFIEKFGKTVEPMFERICKNYEENYSLSKIRDTLLPKLMNGEITVN